jgi:hypothetical protein
MASCSRFRPRSPNDIRQHRRPIATHELPGLASGQGSAVAIPQSRLTLEEVRGASGLRFEPTDKALRWLAGDTLLVSHYEVYSSGFAFFVNCIGSGFFKIPVGGGRAVAVGKPFCQLRRNLTASPNGATVLFFGDPAYARDGPITVKTGDAPLLHMDLVSRSADTLRTGCGSGSKDVALSSTSQLAWTGPCRDSVDIALDPTCTPLVTHQPYGCDPDERDGIYVSQSGGGEVRQAGGSGRVDDHEPSWSPDGASVGSGFDSLAAHLKKLKSHKHLQACGAFAYSYR